MSSHHDRRSLVPVSGRCSRSRIASEKLDRGWYPTVSLIMDQKPVAVSGRLVVVGVGSIGEGVLPLLLRHLVIDPAQIPIITAEPRGNEVAAEYGISFIETALTR